MNICPKLLNVLIFCSQGIEYLENRQKAPATDSGPLDRPYKAFQLSTECMEKVKRVVEGNLPSSCSANPLPPSFTHPTSASFPTVPSAPISATSSFDTSDSLLPPETNPFLDLITSPQLLNMDTHDVIPAFPPTNKHSHSTIPKTSCPILNMLEEVVSFMRRVEDKVDRNKASFAKTHNRPVCVSTTTQADSTPPAFKILPFTESQHHH